MAITGKRIDQLDDAAVQDSTYIPVRNGDAGGQTGKFTIADFESARASIAANGDKLAKRGAEGTLKAADGTDDDDLVTVLQRTQLNEQITKAIKAGNNDDSSLNLNYGYDSYIEGDATTGFDLLHTFNRASEKTGFNQRGELVTFAAGEPAKRVYDPETGELLGLSVHEQRTRLNTVSAAPTAAEDVTVAAVEHTISFYGTGIIDLSGVATQTITGDGAFPVRKEVTFTPTAGTLTITPSGDVQNLQLEEGDFATPWIEGEGTQVTRLADDCSIQDIDQSDWWNPNEGTFVVEFKYIDNSYVLMVNNTSASLYDELIQIEARSSNDVRFNVRTQASTEASLSLPQLVSNGSNRVAVSFSQNQIKMSCNGNAVATELTPSLPSGLNKIFIGGFRDGAKYLNGTIKSLDYIPRAVSDAKLQELSTI